MLAWQAELVQAWTKCALENFLDKYLRNTANTTVSTIPCNRNLQILQNGLHFGYDGKLYNKNDERNDKTETYTKFYCQLNPTLLSVKR